MFEQGIVTTFDTSENGDAAFVNSEAPNIASKDVKIQVEAGGQLKVADGGRLILAGQTVENAGKITGGKQAQLILVASQDKVYLQPAENDGPFAGLLVEVGSGGKVTNLGEIATRQGNITLAGFAVNQSGRVTATTSVDVNGSIRLLARQGARKEGDALAAFDTNRPDDGGDGSGYASTVTFGKNSQTKIIADADGGSAIDEQAQPLSYLEAVANTIHMESDSAIVANGGKVNFTASSDLENTTEAAKGRIVLDAGAVIDVSGTKHISADISRNVQEMSVQSFELRDSPYQKMAY
ncbi:hypothetical protein [Methylocucumis oryzae]|uniref:Filamentous haemagglutinin FhaB/tRNA nuclease CdiA-like TPS domain-containing protein n=1 Tax=Methylocucumis oryzae TaxID=1632867 RepID=A0A0F3IK32_9GAMM|nr:hypothetical protein [Methylocucumis oryzae]KJV07046.1 hypothetical protein VZ94_07225 [Methylocucumis oryzae]